MYSIIPILQLKTTNFRTLNQQHSFLFMKHFAVLFCSIILSSFSLTAQDIDHYETMLQNHVLWNYILPTEEPPSNWHSPDFDGFEDDDWKIGQGGIGYGDDDDNTVIDETISLFMRTEFEIEDLEKIKSLLLFADYDDGMVAFINGVEIVRINVSSNQNFVPFDTEADQYIEPALPYGETPNSFVIDLALLQEGENVLALQIHNEDITSSDLSSNAWLIAGLNTSETIYDELPDWWENYVPPFEFTDSNLPIVLIETVEEINDESRVTGQMRIINNTNADGESERNYITDTPNEYMGQIGIKYRGSSSLAFFDKKSYNVETRLENGENWNVSLFGWPDENDWVLYGPFSDKTMMRNVLTYELGRRQGSYAPRTKYCEVVLNGEYRGVYVFVEKIKKDNGRLDIADLKETDIDSIDVTGGYIVKIDRWDNTSETWPSDYVDVNGVYTINFVHHYPNGEDIKPAQRDYIRGYINDFEDTLFGDDFLDQTTGYKSYIDLQSFADFFLINEFSMNVDAYRLSTYMYKDRDDKDGRLKMGPLWDFNLSFGNADYCSGWQTNQWIYNSPTCDGAPTWWLRFEEDEAFRNMVKCRWEFLRETYWHTDSIMAFIDEQALLLEESQERNYQVFDILGEYVWPNYYIEQTYEAEVQRLKTWITIRLAFMDTNLIGEALDCPVETFPFGTIDTTEMPIDTMENPIDTMMMDTTETSIQTLDLVNTEFEVYPNPSKDYVYIKSDESNTNAFTITIYDTNGTMVMESDMLGQAENGIDISFLPSGIYTIKINTEMENTNQVRYKKIVKF